VENGSAALSGSSDAPAKKEEAWATACANRKPSKLRMTDQRRTLFESVILFYLLSTSTVRRTSQIFVLTRNPEWT
jgi:hypothetical protein